MDMNLDPRFPSPARLQGTFRRFGAYGPVYEILGAATGPDQLRIRVVESGEELAYGYLEVLQDPAES